jgi:hypothetical protein
VHIADEVDGGMQKAASEDYRHAFIPYYGWWWFLFPHPRLFIQKKAFEFNMVRGDDSVFWLLGL